MSIYLEPFDPSRDFVTQAAFRANGRIWGRGYLFAKDSVDIRVLRLLYENRRIIYSDNPRAIKLLSARDGGGGRAKGADAVSRPSPAADPLVVDPQETEDKAVAALMGRYSKTDLLTLAAAIPGVKRSMTKDELARALVRSGHGAT